MILAVIEKGSIGELAFGFSLIFAFVVIVGRTLSWSYRKGNEPTDVWPTLFQVSCADRRTIERWNKELPVPESPDQHKVANEIAHRILHYNGLSVMDAPRPTAESMTCACGHKHPFVHAFGKCGKCMEERAIV
ncbi:hypothetical protein [uncultured Draconibacterium sp.]|uniref:hypothetical protein n=1 Tax=uncultured Draconibacterium sp. TaxID=1573823 RepID=UPI0025ED7497|nr:hypothetical protein [uncultured Draconibacterium sp.]